MAKTTDHEVYEMLAGARIEMQPYIDHCMQTPLDEFDNSAEKPALIDFAAATHIYAYMGTVEKMERTLRRRHLAVPDWKFSTVARFLAEWFKRAAPQVETAIVRKDQEFLESCGVQPTTTTRQSTCNTEKKISQISLPKVSVKSSCLR